MLYCCCRHLLCLSSLALLSRSGDPKGKVRAKKRRERERERERLRKKSEERCARDSVAREREQSGHKKIRTEQRNKRKTKHKTKRRGASSINTCPFSLSLSLSFSHCNRGGNKGGYLSQIANLTKNLSLSLPYPFREEIAR